MSSRSAPVPGGRKAHRIFTLRPHDPHADLQTVLPVCPPHFPSIAEDLMRRHCLPSARLRLESMEERCLPSGWFTDDLSYVRPVEPTVALTPLLTVGEEVARTSNAGQNYRMVVIPDGMGAHATAKGTVRLLLNHELNKDAVSTPVAGGKPVNGAFVSEYLLDPKGGSILSGDLAYNLIYNGAEDQPISDVYTGAFGRFCSAHLADARVGFDLPIFLVGEEATGAATFDGRGGQSVAIVGGAAHLLPEFGRLSWENQVVVPGTGKLTVVIGLEDGPTTPDSQLYMYVGVKNPEAKHPLVRNG